MKTARGTLRGAIAAWLVLVGHLGLLPASNRHASGADSASEILERPGRPALHGRLVKNPGAGLEFLPRSDQPGLPVELEPGASVQFQGTAPGADAIPALFQVQVGETARISGTLQAVIGARGHAERPLADRGDRRGSAGCSNTPATPGTGQGVCGGIQSARSGEVVGPGQGRGCRSRQGNRCSLRRQAGPGRCLDSAPAGRTLDFGAA